MTAKTALATVKASLRKVQWLRVLNYVVAAILIVAPDTVLPTLLPPTWQTHVTAALGLLAAALPRLLKATGLFRPVQPGDLSVFQTIVQMSDAYAAARKDQKTQSTLTALAPLLAPLIAAELNKSRDLNAAALADGIAAKKAEAEAQTVEAEPETVPHTPETEPAPKTETTEDAPPPALETAAA